MSQIFLAVIVRIDLLELIKLLIQAELRLHIGTAIEDSISSQTSVFSWTSSTSVQAQIGNSMEDSTSSKT